MEPKYSPLTSAHCFQSLNSSKVSAFALACSTHRSSSQRPIASSASKYSSVASNTLWGRRSPERCHNKQPSSAQARMPSRSASNFSVNLPSRLSGGMVTVNGIMCSLRFIASSTLRIEGLWLPATSSLNCGKKSKKSWRMKRADTLSPPVMVLIFDSFQRRPCSVSIDATKRAPRRPARSVGCLSERVSIKVSIGALAA